MTCKEFIDFLLEYYEGNLSAERREIFEHHMEICTHCVAYLESYKQVVDLAKEAALAGGADVSDDVPAELIDAILAARPK